MLWTAARFLAEARHPIVVIAKEARPLLSTAHIPIRAECGD